jgi:hypothetical protein
VTGDVAFPVENWLLSFTDWVEKMCRFWLIGILIYALVGFLGCEKPGPIALEQEDYPEPLDVRLFTLHERDTLIVSEYNYDLTGLAPNEEERYPGTILVNGIKMDVEGYPYVYSYSRAVFVEKDSVIPVRGQFGTVYEHPRLDVGDVQVSGVVLEKKEVITQIRSVTLIPIRTGILYRIMNEGNAYTLPFVYRANARYGILTQGRGRISAFADAIESPDEITVVEPRPYSLRFRDEDLVLRWNGRPGQHLAVIISLYDESRLRLGKPVMLLKSSVKSNGLKIPSKLVQLLPRTASGKFLLTVVSANRLERRIDGYSGTVLIQAASIHNVALTVK